ncbi:serine hydrolase domain-containing protein [Georgenia sp. SUBG003]|uniref:serine hydrolase domain-containing protein n=1 Tax=Georgenia sp. SUBG003 TaxID=1497974 RepID=UPI003AB5DCDF
MSPLTARPLPALTRLAGLIIAALLAVVGLWVPGAATVPAQAAPGDAECTSPDCDSVLVAELSEDLESYLRARGSPEHASAAALSVSLPGEETSVDVSAGTMQFRGSAPVPADSVWQIGSNTKAFTSVLLLQLEAEGRLSIEDTVGRWLPQYPQWRDVTIRRLLNMTSGIPTYDEQSAFLADYAADPFVRFSKERLVGYVADLPATSGYGYSNTNYILAEMIIERVTGDSYRDELYERIVEPLGLSDLDYRPHLYPRLIVSRQPAGYLYFNQVPEFSRMVGRDVSRDTVSWGRGAGGILSTMSDLTRWAWACTPASCCLRSSSSS